ncbi:MAG: hypothetical protein HGA22_06385, partial [Clostridiales bacterium]|nr:hypothetical protein [Clostridiales bacterium]
ELAPGNPNLVEMLHSGDISAVIMGSKQGTGGGLKQLIPDVDSAISEWYSKHQTVPVNHMVVVTEDFLKRDPASVKDIFEMLRQGYETSQSGKSTTGPAAIQFGTENVWKAVQLAMQYSVEQKLISRVFDKNEIFADMISF